MVKVMMICDRCDLICGCPFYLFRVEYLPGVLLHATLMMRHLYDMALDNFDR